MLEIRVGREPLNELLEPVAYYLDHCWWFYGGQGITLANSPRGSLGKREGQAAFARFLEESKRRTIELERYVVNSEIGCIGCPGFFSRFAWGLSADWSYYFASDAADLPVSSFRAALDQGSDWFSPPENLPPDICLLIRGIDAGYWNVFFRDEWLFQAAWATLRHKPHASQNSGTRH